MEAVYDRARRLAGELFELGVRDVKFAVSPNASPEKVLSDKCDFIEAMLRGDCYLAPPIGDSMRPIPYKLTDDDLEVL